MAKRNPHKQSGARVKFVCGACTRPLATLDGVDRAYLTSRDAEDYDDSRATVTGRWKVRPNVQDVQQGDDHRLTCPGCRRVATVSWVTRTAVWSAYRDGRDDRGTWNGAGVLVVPV